MNTGPENRFALIPRYVTGGYFVAASVVAIAALAATAGPLLTRVSGVARLQLATILVAVVLIAGLLLVSGARIMSGRLDRGTVMRLSVACFMQLFVVQSTRGSVVLLVGLSAGPFFGQQGLSWFHSYWLAADVSVYSATANPGFGVNVVAAVTAIAVWVLHLRSQRVGAGAP